MTPYLDQESTDRKLLDNNDEDDLEVASFTVNVEEQRPSHAKHVFFKNEPLSQPLDVISDELSIVEENQTPAETPAFVAEIKKVEYDNASPVARLD